mgnify:CR=1 FL=1
MPSKTLRRWECALLVLAAALTLFCSWLGGYQERSIIRTRAALYALDMLRRMALGLPVPDSLAITPDTPATTMDI